MIIVRTDDCTEMNNNRIYRPIIIDIRRLTLLVQDDHGLFEKFLR